MPKKPWGLPDWAKIWIRIMGLKNPTGDPHSSSVFRMLNSSLVLTSCGELCMLDVYSLLEQRWEEPFSANALITSIHFTVRLLVILFFITCVIKCTEHWYPFYELQHTISINQNENNHVWSMIVTDDSHTGTGSHCKTYSIRWLLFSWSKKRSLEEELTNYFCFAYTMLLYNRYVFSVKVSVVCSFILVSLTAIR